jgi:hypothetical protein
MCCKCASLHSQSTNLLGRCAKGLNSLSLPNEYNPEMNISRSY